MNKENSLIYPIRVTVKGIDEATEKVGRLYSALAEGERLMNELQTVKTNAARLYELLNEAEIIIEELRSLDMEAGLEAVTDKPEEQHDNQ